jgi:hypothetical protein
MSRGEQSARIEKGVLGKIFALDSLSLSLSDLRRYMLSQSGSDAGEASRIALCWSAVCQDQPFMMSLWSWH